MNDPDIYFAVPTHRLRDVGETVHEYDEHFRRNGHSPKMIIFDDSTPTNVEKYFPQLETVKTKADLYYVGPREKDEFITYVNSRLRNKRLEPPALLCSKRCRRRSCSVLLQRAMHPLAWGNCPMSCS